ncbi:TIGR03086 family metal-binding protein [Saccharopolyspora erythraea]|uniref:TIGR03086 family metal-binding protein n=1 Tax=Saccharopolyspora erythraea TaxID=1836 RepID=UPI002013BB28|nr:TIGR03086 family metal-binding protein [Saccharopolyspora erythraea]
MDFLEDVIDLFTVACAGFERMLREVRPDQWTSPTPCAEWDVRQLVNHVARGNLNYVALLDGCTAAGFLRMRDADALGADPVGAYTRSARECTAAFTRPGALRQVLDYPLGPIQGRQALAVRTVDTAVHTWDLARAIGASEELDTGLIAWIDGHLDGIYAGLAETPTSASTTHRFFAAPGGAPEPGASQQDRLLHRMGRRPVRVDEVQVPDHT